MSNLILLRGNFLAPKGAIATAVVQSLPGVFEYEGQVVIAVTDNAFWMVAPNEEHLMIPYRNIRSVRPDQFPGIVYREYVDGVETLVAPNDTAGVTVEFKEYAEFYRRLSFLTFYPNKAHEWARTIENAVSNFNRRKFEEKG